MSDLVSPTVVTLHQMKAVSPYLARATEAALFGDVWKRPGLSARDRSLITVASLVARCQPLPLTSHLRLALDNGVTATELSELIAHLAFYSGWPNASSAIAVAAPIFAERGIDADQLPGSSVELTPLDEVVEALRVDAVDQMIGDTFPALAQYTTDLLFRNLWLRPGLAPRDRSLVTVAALITAGLPAQITFHMNKAMDNGLTREQASEVVTHLAFYAGWAKATQAMTALARAPGR